MSDLWSKIFSDVFVVTHTMVSRRVPELGDALTVRIAVDIGVEVATRITDPTLPPLEEDRGTQTDGPPVQVVMPQPREPQPPQPQGPLARTMAALRTLERDRQEAERRNDSV